MSNLKLIKVMAAIIAICDKESLEKIFLNDKNEIFTAENYAAGSVKGDKKRYKTVTVAEAKAELTRLKKAPAAKPEQTKAAAAKKAPAKKAAEKPDGGDTGEDDKE